MSLAINYNNKNESTTLNQEKPTIAMQKNMPI